MKPTWSEEIPIRSFDVDCKNQLKISSLCNYFQEVAGHHAEHLGLGFDHVRQAGLVWVLSRLEIAFIKFPQRGDHMTIETWPTGHERLYYRREFLVTGLDGEKLITAVSFWLLISMQNRRPKILPLPSEIEKQNVGKYVMQAMTESIPLPSTGETTIIPVRYGDLDLNQHVNNVRYVYWVTDLFPVEFHYHHVPVFFRIDFRQEVKANDSVQITKSGNSKDFIFEGKNCTAHTTCFQAVLSFHTT
jgi:medium-chain acyl-[acyl-carrier-protein] hydrolase